MKVSDLAAAANLSVGMLSKIENGGISPSLTTLQAISRGLAVPITWLVSRFEAERTAIFVRAGAHGGTASASQKKRLGHTGVDPAGFVVEPCMITLTRETDIFPSASHQGMVFLYMRQGEIVYRHGCSLHRMTPGDSLFFDADTLHGPDAIIELPVRCLSITSSRHR